jgi:hypothetical protein
MRDPRSLTARFEQGFEIHGVRIAVGASDREALDQLVGLLPAGASSCDPGTADRRFTLIETEEGIWQYESGNGRSPMFTDLELVITMVDTELRNYVASSAPDRLFVHAGAVAYLDKAIVVPGKTFSGKSMLVAALVRAGAVYYSDELAILDRDGLVHPYARPLSIRTSDPQANPRHTVESLGGTIGEQPLRLGLITATRYRPGANFSPQRRSAAQGMLTLLANTSGTRERPTDTMTVLKRAVSSALVLEGERGEADAAARLLLEMATDAFPDGARTGQ